MANEKANVEAAYENLKKRFKKHSRMLFRKPMTKKELGDFAKVLVNAVNDLLSSADNDALKNWNGHFSGFANLNEEKELEMSEVQQLQDSLPELDKILKTLPA